jgi:hypothetical protein
MQQNVARRPRFKRVSDLPPISLTERDKAILSAVSRFRFLTTSHIHSLVSGSGQSISRRLQRLYHAGFLDRPIEQLPLRFSGDLSELVYAPTARIPALEIPRGTVSGKRYGRISSLFLQHALSVSDALIAVELACRREGIAFTTEQEIVCLESGDRKLRWRVSVKSGRASQKIGVIPDAAFAIEQRNRSGKLQRFNYFLEVDRGTMPIWRKNIQLSSIHRKALAYSQTRRSKMLKDKFGMLGFQVLFITASKDRLERMKEVCSEGLHGHHASLFIFTTPDEFRRDPLAKLSMI